MKKIILSYTLFLSLTAAAAPQDSSESESQKMVQPLVVQYESQDVFKSKLPDDLSEYNYLDPQSIIPTEPLTQAVRFYKGYKQNIVNQKYITIIDMTQHSSKKRMYVVNMETGVVSTYLAAHGKNSDKNNDGYAETFSNTNGSNMSSLGFYLTGVTYSGKHGLSLKMHGLQSTNSNAYARAIVMHGADYVTSSRAGRSFGCPAIEMKYVKTLIPAIKGRSLMYIYKKSALKK